MHNYLTIAQAAQELNLSRQRIQQFIKAGRLKADKIGQRQWMIERREVKRFQARERKAGKPQRRQQRAG